MKKFLLLLLLTLAGLTANAQITVAINGNVAIGNQNKSSAKYGASALDIYGLSVYGQAYASFGLASSSIPNVLVGESTANGGVFWMHGERGFLITKSRFAARRDSLAYYRNAVEGVVFRANVKAKSVYQYSPTTSTSSLAKSASSSNIHAVEKAVNSLQRLNAVPYVPEVEQEDEDVLLKASAKTSAIDNTHYAIVTDELKELFPALVYTDSVGNDYVNYTGLIPLLVEAVKDLSRQVDELRSGSSALSPLAVQAASTAGSADVAVLKSELGQNKPNPFRSTTTIQYQLEDKAMSADIYIYDMQGSQIASYTLDPQLRQGQLQIEGSMLSPGMYLYTLIVNGAEVSTKRMILTN